MGGSSGPNADSAETTPRNDARSEEAGTCDQPVTGAENRGPDQDVRVAGGTTDPAPPGARGYSWPPFTGPDGDKPGELAPLTHGAFANGARFQAVAAEVARDLLAELGDEVTTADVLDVEAIATTRAKLRRANAYLDEHGQWDDDGAVRSVAEYCNRLARLEGEQRSALWRRRAERQRRSADGGPAALAALRAEGRAILQARTAAAALPTGDQDLGIANGAQKAAQGPESGS